MSNPCFEMPILYAVYADHVDRRLLLGIASGDPKDIEAFYDNEKAYGLILERLKPILVPTGYAAARDALLSERRIVEAQLEDLDRQLKKLRG